MLFMLLPIYTRYFTTAQYGILNTINSVSQLLVLAVSLYLDSAFGRFYHDAVSSREELRKLVSTVYTVTLLWGSAVTGLILFTSHFWAGELLGIPAWPHIYLAFIPQIFSQLFLIGSVYMRQSLQVKFITLLQFLSGLLNVGLTIVMITGFGMNIEARLLSNAVTIILTCSIISVVFYSKGYLSFTINLTMLKELLAYSIPLLPFAASGWITSLSDRVIISKYDSIASTGLYAFAFQIAHILYVIQDSITQVTSPISISGLINEKKITIKKIERISRVLFLFMLLLSLGMFLFAREMIHTILFLGKGDPAYLDSAMLIFVLALVYVFSSQYRIFEPIITLHKKTWISSSGGILMALLNLGLNLIFIPRYGRTAAAVTTVLSTVFYTVWIVSWAKRLERINLRYSLYLTAFIGFFGLIVLINYRFAKLLYVNLGNFIIKTAAYLLLCALFMIFFKLLGSPPQSVDRT